MINFELNDYESIDVEEFNKYLDSYGGYTGWMNLDNLRSSLPEIKETAEYIRNNSEVLLVVGVGGSYMASKAVTTALNPYFESGFEIYYLGYQLSDSYYNDLLEKIKDKDIMINVISKSGSTLEIKVFYELLLEFMKTKYNEEEIKERIVVTTCLQDSYLYNEANAKGYKILKHPDDVGGRYTLFTPVHTLPMLVSGVDVEKMFDGAIDSMDNLEEQVKYSMFRNEMFKSNKLVEVYTVYEEKLQYLIEWLKQLYAESLGKDGRGILPFGVVNTRDLHSLEQFFQEGNPITFETIINIENTGKLSDINRIVRDSVLKAHDRIPSIVINMDKLDEYNLGYLMQFMMYSCAISGYIEGVNPFNQPGVEKYKSEIKRLID